MNLFSISCLLIVCFTLPMALFIFLKNFNKVNSYWGYFCIITSIYGIGAFKYSNTLVKDAAYFWMQISYIGVIFAPVLFFQFISNFFQLRKKYFIASSYFLAFVFLFLVFFKKQLFFGDLDIIFYEFYSINWWKSRSLVFLIFYISFYWFLLLYAFFYVVKAFINSSGSKRNQLKYFLIAMSIGWLGPHGFFLTHFGLTIYPYSNFLVAVYPLIIGYAIVRYRLMDISLVITRSSIFIAVYSIVLGLPFLFAFGLQDWLKSYLGDMWWLSPLILLTVLATAGPFIYLYIQRRAEEKLFEDQRRYQATLRQAATGMGRIKDMDKLVGLIENLIKESVGVEHCKVYMEGLMAHSSSLMAKSKTHEPETMSNEQSSVFIEPSALPGRQAAMSHEQNDVFVYSELKQRAMDNPDAKLDDVVAQMEALNAELIVPVALDQKVIAHLVIGRKVSGELFTDDDISVFQILAGQAALGFENAQYYDDIKSANEKLFQAEKLAYVGTMASSIVHEIRNPLTSIKAYLEFLPQKYHEPEFREKFNRLIPGEVSRIEHIVGQLLDLVKRKPLNFYPVNLVEMLDATLEMLENSFQLKNIEICKNYHGRPMVKGDAEQLKQVFMNLFLNAVQAMNEGGTLTVDAVQKDQTVEICVADTGCGISTEQMQKLFQPFVTTKKDGIGLGLPILKEIVENHNGSVVYKSEYMHGTRVYVTLPTS